jgi:uncharacterized protein
VRFEWDAAKAQANWKKHRTSFDEAVSVFYDAVAATFTDPAHSVDESRFVTVGYSVAGRLLVVCHTDRDGAVHHQRAPSHPKGAEAP